MSQSARTLFIGFVAGFLFGLVLIGVIRPRGIRPSDRVIAKFNGVELKENELRERIAEQLAPAENEEYRSLQAGAQDWINTRLLEKEAKARGVDIKEIYKDVWNRVHVDYEDMLQVYNQNKESYGNQSFEQAGGLIASQLRTIKYGEAKKAYVQELHKKYHVEIFLEKPKILIEGSAPPIQLKIGESATVRAEGGEVQPEAPSPSVATGAAPEVGIGADGAPTKGSPSAPIKMVEFADFHCHFCRKVAATLEKIVQNYPDKVQLIFRHYPLSSSPGSGSFLTHEASACANEQGKFWEFYDEIYKTESSPKPDDLESLAANVGLDMGKYKECMQSHRYQSAIQNDIAAGKAKGVQGTPTIFVNEEAVNGAYPYEYFVDLVNNILTPGKVKPVKKPVQPSLAAEGPVEFNNNDLKGRPSMGPDNAPITIVEFSDFHCPFCKRVGPALEQVMKNYKGKVRRVWRHYPLPMHAGADRTHQASECANEQGKFWQYHDKIFETQGGPRDDKALTDLAKEAGLNVKNFKACLTSEKYKDLVEQEVTQGSAVGVSGTPSLFINGEKLPGAVPYESFQGIIDNLLEPGKAPKAPKPSKAAQPAAPSGPVEFNNNDLKGRPSMGPDNAPITIVEFSDFHCPFCKRVGPTLEQVMKNYKGKVRRVWRHYPLPMHAGADRTHQASECANEQGKFWQYHDKIFETQGSKDDQLLMEISKQAGLDQKKFEKCLSQGKYKNLIQQEIAKGNQVGVRGTPTLFVNGQRLPGAVPYESFDSIIKSELAKKS